MSPEELQLALLGDVFAGPDMGEGASQLIASLLANGSPSAPTQPFKADELDLLDVRQGMQSPEWLASKYGVTREEVLQAYPEFRRAYGGNQPTTSTQPGQPPQRFNPFGIVSDAIQAVNEGR